MEKQQPAKRIPPEQTRMVKMLITESGIGQDVISRASESVARAHKALCPGLPDRLTAPTISRMATGSGLKKLRRCNLLLLHLTIHSLRDPRADLSAPSPTAVGAANEFTDTVLLAAAWVTGPQQQIFQPERSTPLPDSR